jgi:ABC-2 type transport system ATP-binding protein
MIHLQSVTKTFKRVRVLDGLSLDIGREERVALVGSNGAGKTTLIRCLLGEYHHEGLLTIDGRSPRADRAEVLAKVGFVPQLPPPLKMPVGELIRFTAGVGGTDPGRMEEIGVRMGLDMAAIRRRPFVKLSGGMKQKVLIAVALGRDAELLILDEPAANLDPAARRVLFGLLEERKSGTMLITSHRLDEVAALVTRVIEMDGGRVVLDDKVQDAVSLAGLLSCRLTIARPDEAFARAVGEWFFRDAAPGTSGAGRTWVGEVAGPDRLRFLGMLSRYAGLLTGIDMQETSEVAHVHKA